MPRLLILFFSFSFLLTELCAELNISKSLSSNMVFQSDKPIKIWGKAKPNTQVNVTFVNEKKSTFSSNSGEWEIILSKHQPNSTGQSIIIKSGESLIKLSNILIGEVWFCAGQSNMAMKLPGTQDYQKAKDYLHNHQIRFLAMNKRPYTKPFSSNLPEGFEPTPENIKNFYQFTDWKTCEGSEISKLSAVAYWFANSLHRELKVPIGLIVPPLGGSATQAWVSRESFENHTEIKPLLNQWIQDEPEKLQQQFKGWITANSDYHFDQTPLHRHRPTTLFEAAVQPIQNHHISGVIWYQGEQNAQNAVQRNWFKKCFPKLINDFRNNWKQTKLPFYYVQLPGYGDEEWPAFRDLQQEALTIPNTGMATTIDLGLLKDIHPKDKSPIGKRLAKLALKRKYLKQHIQDQGPYIINITREDQFLLIEFDKSLNLEKDEIFHFELAGDNQEFHPAKAHGYLQTIKVQSDLVANPKYVRYAWKSFPRPIQLKNEEGLPTTPFTLSLPK